jgi:hypothetical protein
MYCRRCDDVVTAVVPWQGWKRLRIAWWAAVVLLLALSPILGADYCVMIPSAFAFVFAGGTLHRLANEQPFCSLCSLPLEPGRAAGTGVHVRPAQRS